MDWLIDYLLATERNVSNNVDSPCFDFVRLEIEFDVYRIQWDNYCELCTTNIILEFQLSRRMHIASMGICQWHPASHFGKSEINYTSDVLKFSTVLFTNSEHVHISSKHMITLNRYFTSYNDFDWNNASKLGWRRGGWNNLYWILQFKLKMFG